MQKSRRLLHPLFLFSMAAGASHGLRQGIAGEGTDADISGIGDARAVAQLQAYNELMMDAWVSFARKGDPENGWKPWSNEKQDYLSLI